MSSTTPPPGALRVPEEKLAVAGALGAAAVALPAAAVAYAVDAPVPAVAGGALLVAVLALAALPLYRLGSAAGNEMVVAMSLAALGLRVVLALAVFAGLSFLTDVPMTAVAAGLASGLIASITAEMLAAARDPRFFWVQTERQRT